MSKKIFIGDVHGCLDELQELIIQVDLQEDDQLVFVGDLLHKGPNSEGVFSYVLKLMETYKVDIICGNHEEKQLRWMRAEARHLETGAKNKMSNVEEYPLITITDQARELMRNSYIARQYGNITAVHAGIPGGLPELEYLTHDQWLTAGGKRKKALGQVMRVRYLSGPNKTKEDKHGNIVAVPEGKMLALGQQEPGDPYWADVYDGRFGTVIFGHNPFMQDEPAVFPHAFGIDLGCVHGGSLCALISEGESISHITVKARRTYRERPAWVYDN